MQRITMLVLLFTSAITYSQSDFSVASIPVNLSKQANSVLLYELIDVDVSKDGKMVVTSHREVSVLNKRGDFHTDTVLYYDNFTKISAANVYVYDAFGKEIEHFRKKDFHDVSAVDGSTLYSESRALYLDYTPSSYPYTLVFNSKIETSNTAFIEWWKPAANYATSTKKSVFKLSFDPANKPRYMAKNFEGYNISITESPNQFVFEAENIPAIQYEDHSKSFSNIAPIAKFSLNKFYLKGVLGYAKDWKEFGNWMQQSLLSDVNELPPGTVAKIKNLVEGETTNIGKARKVYQYLQEKVRYISVQIGIGGWKPMLASEVDQLSYGDCKALSNYTRALLEVVGVPSYYTILYTGEQEMDITKDFSSIQGDHAILGIPEGDDIIWLECTSQDTPFGFGGNHIDDRDVLIITPEGGKIVHTKKYEAAESLQENSGNISLNTDGSINATIKVVSKGLQYEDKYSLEKETVDELDVSYKRRWSYVNGLNIENTTIVNDRTNIVFTEEVKVKATNYATSMGDDLLFCPNVFNQNQYIPPRISNRKQELFISESYMDVDIFEIKFPQNYAVDSLPEAIVLENEFGSYRISFEIVSENLIKYSRTVIINKGTFPPEAYNTYRSFRRKIAKADKTKVLLTPKNS
ncbi:DUF3857 domain-containing protein [Ulvibacter antarcticus]|uniref:Uncharacterized protein DUF3857 n=1 Tax=Ulvibacter antarcticus TaxID=442714 RepID=A0A3L9YCT8_9FLAO|nr:DUF3857 domain-containing protein [Ulvibacter antarcticus]RMA57200.1 uncharacterized protein DUF3857 [Ulvibacter antarcticus]